MYNTYRDPTGCYGDHNIATYPPNVEDSSKMGPNSSWQVHSSSSSGHNLPLAGSAAAPAPPHYHSTFHHHADAYGYTISQVHKETDPTPSKDQVRATPPPNSTSNNHVWQNNRPRYAGGVSTGGAFLPYPQLGHFEASPLETAGHIHGHNHGRKPTWPGENSYSSIPGPQYQRDPSMVFAENLRPNGPTSIIRHTTNVSAQQLPPAQQHIPQQQSSQQSLLHHQQQHMAPHHELFSQLVQKEREARRLPGYQESVRRSVVRGGPPGYHDPVYPQHQPPQFCNSQDMLRKPPLLGAGDIDRCSAFTSRQGATFNHMWNKANMPFLPYHPQMPPSHRTSGSAFQPCGKVTETDIYSNETLMWAKGGQADHPGHSQISNVTNGHPLRPVHPGQTSWISEAQSQMFSSRQLHKQGLSASSSSNMLTLEPGQVDTLTNRQTAPTNLMSYTISHQHLHQHGVHMNQPMVQHPPPPPPLPPPLPPPPPPPPHQASPLSNPQHSPMVPSPHTNVPSPCAQSQQHVRREDDSKDANSSSRPLRSCLDVRQFLATWDEDTDVATPRPCIEESDLTENLDQTNNVEDNGPLVVLESRSLQREEAANLLNIYPSVNINTVPGADSILTCSGENMFNGTSEAVVMDSQTVAHGVLQNLLDSACGTSSGSSSTTIATPMTSPSARTLDILLCGALPTPPASQEHNVIQTSLPLNTPVSMPVLNTIHSPHSNQSKIDGSGFGLLSPSSPPLSLKFDNSAKYPVLNDNATVIQSSRNSSSFLSISHIEPSEKREVSVISAPVSDGPLPHVKQLDLCAGTANHSTAVLTSGMTSVEDEVAQSPVHSDASTDSKRIALRPYRKRKLVSSDAAGEMQDSFDSHHSADVSESFPKPTKTSLVSDVEGVPVDRSKWAFAQIHENAKSLMTPNLPDLQNTVKTVGSWDFSDPASDNKLSRGVSCSSSDFLMTHNLLSKADSAKSDNMKYDKSTSLSVELSNKDTQTEENCRKVQPANKGDACSFGFSDGFAQVSVENIHEEIEALASGNNNLDKIFNLPRPQVAPEDALQMLSSEPTMRDVSTATLDSKSDKENIDDVEPIVNTSSDTVSQIKVSEVSNICSLSSSSKLTESKKVNSVGESIKHHSRDEVSPKYHSRIVNSSPGNIPKILLSRLRRKSNEKNGVIKKLPSIRLTRVNSPMSNSNSEPEYVCSVSDVEVGTQTKVDKVDVSLETVAISSQENDVASQTCNSKQASKKHDRHSSKVSAHENSNHSHSSSPSRFKVDKTMISDGLQEEVSRQLGSPHNLNDGEAFMSENNANAQEKCESSPSIHHVEGNELNAVDSLNLVPKEPEEYPLYKQQICETNTSLEAISENSGRSEIAVASPMISDKIEESSTDNLAHHGPVGPKETCANEETTRSIGVTALQIPDAETLTDQEKDSSSNFTQILSTPTKIVDSEIIYQSLDSDIMDSQFKDSEHGLLDSENDVDSITVHDKEVVSSHKDFGKDELSIFLNECDKVQASSEAVISCKLQSDLQHPFEDLVDQLEKFSSEVKEPQGNKLPPEHLQELCTFAENSLLENEEKRSTEVATQLPDNLFNGHTFGESLPLKMCSETEEHKHTVDNQCDNLLEISCETPPKNNPSSDVLAVLSDANSVILQPQCLSESKLPESLETGPASSAVSMEPEKAADLQSYHETEHELPTSIDDLHCDQVLLHQATIIKHLSKENIECLNDQNDDRTEISCEESLSNENISKEKLPLSPIIPDNLTSNSSNMKSPDDVVNADSCYSETLVDLDANPLSDLCSIHDSSKQEICVEGSNKFASVSTSESEECFQKKCDEEICSRFDEIPSPTLESEHIVVLSDAKKLQPCDLPEEKTILATVIERDQESKLPSGDCAPFIPEYEGSCEGEEALLSDTFEIKVRKSDEDFLLSSESGNGANNSVGNRGETDFPCKDKNLYIADTETRVVFSEKNEQEICETTDVTPLVPESKGEAGCFDRCEEEADSLIKGDAELRTEINGETLFSDEYDQKVLKTCEESPPVPDKVDMAICSTKDNEETELHTKEDQPSIIETEDIAVSFEQHEQDRSHLVEEKSPFRNESKDGTKSSDEIEPETRPDAKVDSRLSPETVDDDVAPLADKMEEEVRMSSVEMNTSSTVDENEAPPLRSDKPERLQQDDKVDPPMCRTEDFAQVSENNVELKETNKENTNSSSNIKNSAYSFNKSVYGECHHNEEAPPLSPDDEDAPSPSAKYASSNSDGSCTLSDEERAFPDPERPDFDVTRIPLPDECEAIKNRFRNLRSKKRPESDRCIAQEKNTDCMRMSSPPRLKGKSDEEYHAVSVAVQCSQVTGTKRTFGFNCKASQTHKIKIKLRPRPQVSFNSLSSNSQTLMEVVDEVSQILDDKIISIPLPAYKRPEKLRRSENTQKRPKKRGVSKVYAASSSLNQNQKYDLDGARSTTVPGSQPLDVTHRTCIAKDVEVPIDSMMKTDEDLPDLRRTDESLIKIDDVKPVESEDYTCTRAQDETRDDCNNLSHFGSPRVNGKDTPADSEGMTESDLHTISVQRNSSPERSSHKQSENSPYECDTFVGIVEDALVNKVAECYSKSDTSTTSHSPAEGVRDQIDSDLEASKTKSSPEENTNVAVISPDTEEISVVPSFPPEVGPPENIAARSTTNAPEEIFQRSPIHFDLDNKSRSQCEAELSGSVEQSSKLEDNECQIAKPVSDAADHAHLNPESFHPFVSEEENFQDPRSLLNEQFCLEEGEILSPMSPSSELELSPPRELSENPCHTDEGNHEDENGKPSTDSTDKEAHRNEESEHPREEDESSLHFSDPCHPSKEHIDSDARPYSPTDEIGVTLHSHTDGTVAEQGVVEGAHEKPPDEEPDLHEGIDVIEAEEGETIIASEGILKKCVEEDPNGQIEENELEEGEVSSELEMEAAQPYASQAEEVEAPGRPSSPVGTMSIGVPLGGELTSPVSPLAEAVAADVAPVPDPAPSPHALLPFATDKSELTCDLQRMDTPSPCTEPPGVEMHAECHANEEATQEDDASLGRVQPPRQDSSEDDLPLPPLTADGLEALATAGDSDSDREMPRLEPVPPVIAILKPMSAPRKEMPSLPLHSHNESDSDSSSGSERGGSTGGHRKHRNRCNSCCSCSDGEHKSEPAGGSDKDQEVVESVACEPQAQEEGDTPAALTDLEISNIRTMSVSDMSVWSGSDVVPVPVDSVYNWPYVEEVFTEAGGETPPQQDWVAEQERPQLRCSLSWDRILPEGERLVLGPAKIEVRLADSPAKGVACWNVINRDRRRGSAESVASSCQEENNNLMPGAKSPLVMVKKLILKRPNDRRRTQSQSESEQDSGAECSGASRQRGRPIKTKGALKSYQLIETDRALRRKRSWPRGGRCRGLRGLRGLRGPRGTRGSRSSRGKRWCSEMSSPGSASTIRSPGTADSDVSCGEIPKVIIKRKNSDPDGGRLCYESFLQSPGPGTSGDQLQLTPVVVLCREPSLDAMALQLRARRRKRFKGEPVEDAGRTPTEKQNTNNKSPSSETNGANILHVVELLKRWRQEEEEKAAAEGNEDLVTTEGWDTMDSHYPPLSIPKAVPSPCERSPEGQRVVLESDRHLSPCMVSGESPAEDDSFVHRCDACEVLLRGAAARAAHIKQHPYHCQRCFLAFPAQMDFMQHLKTAHPNTKELHHCLLCLQTFPTEEQHTEHVKSWSHMHIERSQRRTIHTLYRMFTGADCPRLSPLTPEDIRALDWLPNDSGVIHFYHQATPLQLATEDWHVKHGKPHLPD